MSNILPFPSRRRGIAFTRGELRWLLALHARQVQAHLWQDYALSQGSGVPARFAVYQHCRSSGPLLQIVKWREGKGMCFRLEFRGRTVHEGQTLEGLRASLSECLPRHRGVV